MVVLGKSGMRIRYSLGLAGVVERRREGGRRCAVVGFVVGLGLGLGRVRERRAMRGSGIVGCFEGFFGGGFDGKGL